MVLATPGKAVCSALCQFKLLGRTALGCSLACDRACCGPKRGGKVVIVGRKADMRRRMGGDRHTG